MRKEDFVPRDPNALPKGMVIPVEEKRIVSQKVRNYSGEILAAISAIDGLDISCVHMEVVEDLGSDPVVTIVLEVREVS